MKSTSGNLRTMTVVSMAALLVLVLAACGGGDSGSSNGVSDPVADASSGERADGGTDSGGGDGRESGNATAILTIGADVYTWTAEQMSVCSIDGIFPANADFGVPPSQDGEGPWVQFIDRGDGGINFSAVIDGEEYAGTGSGEADEIRSDGFTYTGAMNRGGEVLDVELEVSC